MLSQNTIALYLQYAQISQYLASNDQANQLAFKGGVVNNNLAQQIYMARNAVQWAYDYYPGTQQETATALYMYSLCGKYISQAQQIIGNAGGIIINPATGGRSTLVAIDIQFVIGVTGSPMTAGDTVLTLNYNYIQDGSIDVFLGGVLLPQSQTDQISYTIVYSTSNVVITFNQGVMDTQLYRIKGQYFVAII